VAAKRPGCVSWGCQRDGPRTKTPSASGRLRYRTIVLQGYDNVSKHFMTNRRFWDNEEPLGLPIMPAEDHLRGVAPT
jgi:hypothetical protein